MDNTTSPPAPLLPTADVTHVKRANRRPLVAFGALAVVIIVVICWASGMGMAKQQVSAISAKNKPALGSARNIINRAPSGVIDPPATPTPKLEPEVHKVQEIIKSNSSRSIELRQKALESTGVVPVVSREARTMREASLPLGRLLPNEPMHHSDVDNRIQDLLSAHAATNNGEDNHQDEKQNFATSTKDDFLLDAQIVEPKGFREIKTGSVIPAVLMTGVNSDLPGELIAQVSQDVFDSRSGDFLLVPAGAKLFGRYDSQVVYGQSRVLVVWDRLIHPDGRAIALKSMLGADTTGAAGFADDVHNHYGRIFGSALLMSIISAGVQLSQPTGRTFGGYDAQQQIAASLGQQLGQVGMEVTRKNLQVQPTIVIRPGFRFNVIVNKDIVIPEHKESSE